MPFWRKTVIQPALEAAENAASTEQQELLKQDPSNPKAHFALGSLAQLRGRPEEAIEHFSRAIEADPSYAAPHVSVGRIFAIQGNMSLAWKHAREAERLGDRSLVEQLERYPAAAPPER